MIIAEIIKLLQSHHFEGAGKFTEIAKGRAKWQSQKK